MEVHFTPEVQASLEQMAPERRADGEGGGGFL
jgi:hypothetical protein